MSDYNNFLMDLYVIEFAPIFAQEWFRTLLGIGGSSIYVTSLIALTVEFLETKSWAIGVGPY